MAQSLAEQFRTARENMELALQLGCTPREAAIERQKRAAGQQWEATRARLEAKMNAPLRPRGSHASGAADPEPAQRSEPWMMRD